MNSPLPIEFRIMLAKTHAAILAERDGTEIVSRHRFMAASFWHHEPTDSRADMKSLVTGR